MAVADTRDAPPRVGVGWRAAGAFARWREASIFLVLVALSVYF